MKLKIVLSNYAHQPDPCYIV